MRLAPEHGRAPEVAPDPDIAGAASARPSLPSRVTSLFTRSAALGALPAVALAVGLAVISEVLRWHGVDTPAQVYRVDQYRLHGFQLWDFGWYAGHWEPGYSLLYPPVAAALGIPFVTVASAGLASFAFDRMARTRMGLGPVAGWMASLVFAAGTVVPAAIGQLTFLVGGALALACLYVAAGAARGRGVAAGGVAIALPLALASSLTSPLAGAFVALAGVAWALAGGSGGSGRFPRPSTKRRGCDRRTLVLGLGIAAVAGIPMLAGTVLFPGDGPMPYPAVDWAWEVVVALAIGALAWRLVPTVAAGAALVALTATASELFPSSLGGNIGRIEDAVALPLAVGLAWQRARLLLPLAAVPLALSQWSPAWGAMTSAPSLPSAQRSFFTPLDRELVALGASGPAGRVEVVPTEYHWEAAYVAPVMALARGWERQLDEADNPIFYRSGQLTPSSYRTWLFTNGVRFVAVPDAPLDMAGGAEAALVRSGTVFGLEPVWSDAGWDLFEVEGSGGVVSGPAALVSASNSRIVLDASLAGSVTVRVHYSPGWTVAGGDACIDRIGGSPGWIGVDVRSPGKVTLGLSLSAALGGSRSGSDHACQAGANSASRAPATAG